MSVLKIRKTSDAPIGGGVRKESCDQISAESKEDDRREVVFFPEFCEAPVQIDTSEKSFGENVAPLAAYFPEFRSFVWANIPNSCVRVRLNLPKLVIPRRLLKPDEDAMRDLRILLSDMGFEVLDRATLAFFAIGSEHDYQKAALRFLKFHKLANTAEFKSPSREILQLIDNYGLIEGFALHMDGTFGGLIHVQEYKHLVHNAMYIVRELLCYICSMVDLSLLRRGYTSVVNARNFHWKAFAPFENAKTLNLIKGCMPLKAGRKYVIDPGYYARLAHNTCKPIIPEEYLKVTFLLTADKVRLEHPHLVLPKSITGLTGNKFIKHLSVVEQVGFTFFLENITSQ